MFVLGFSLGCAGTWGRGRVLKVLHMAKGTGWNREINLWTVGFIAVATAVAITFLHPLYNPHTCYPGPASAINPEACARQRNVQVLNSTKQIGVSACIYATDYNDTFPIWSSAMGESEVLDSDRLYPEVMKNYAKDQEAWTNPKVDLQMRGVRNAFAYNFWGLGGIFQCANSNYAAESPLCTDRSEERFAEFADEKYNRPARMSEIEDISRTVLFVEGSVLARPPQFGIAFPQADAKYIGVWSLTKAGVGPLSGPAGVSNAKGALARFLSGTRTTMVGTDSSAKSKATSELYGTAYSTPDWQGTLINNAGWSRESAE
jgi:hypothetical protein